MNAFSNHPLSQLSKLAFSCVLWINVCAVLPAQTVVESNQPFEVSGRVTAKTKYGFEVRTQDGQTLEILANDATDFAMRLSNPWFDVEKWKVAVDGPDDGSSGSKRIRFELPEGKLYLLAQFRTPRQRDRTLKTSPWRINNYLISDDPIEAVVPDGDQLILAGELDLKKSLVQIGDRAFPIILGHRGATLRSRSIVDIVPGKTVVLVTGTEVAGKKTAETVLFMIK